MLTDTKLIVLDKKVVGEDELTSEVELAYKEKPVGYSKAGLEQFLITLRSLPEAAAKTVVQVLVKAGMESGG